MSAEGSEDVARSSFIASDRNGVPCQGAAEPGSRPLADWSQRAGFVKLIEMRASVCARNDYKTARCGRDARATSWESQIVSK